jgi:hypothetical protein
VPGFRAIGSGAAGRYAWFVRSAAADESVGEWSAGRYFVIPATPSASQVRQALEVLERWQATDARPSRRSLPAPWRQGSRTPGELKSVTTGSAALRGEHPDTSGEAYGVVGISASTEGAGVAAANTSGGADLELDGAADGATSAWLTESGLDRASPAQETFALTNSGPGTLHLEVDGDVRADTLRTDELVVNGATVIDDNGDWLGSGSTVPCAGCVRSSDIADATIAGDDLSDGAVGRGKIANGAVDANALRSNAVTSAKIADGTITAADVDQASSIYVSKSQLYLREETILVSGTTSTSTLDVECDDANDLPLAGSCEIDPASGIIMAGTQDLDWDSSVSAAGWRCRFWNRIGALNYPITSRILCISVP